MPDSKNPMNTWCKILTNLKIKILHHKHQNWSTENEILIGSWITIFIKMWSFMLFLAIFLIIILKSLIFIDQIWIIKFKLLFIINKILI